MYIEKFIKELPKDASKAIYLILNEFYEQLTRGSNVTIDYYLETLSLILVYYEELNEEVVKDLTIPEMTVNDQDTRDNIEEFFAQLNRVITYQRSVKYLSDQKTKYSSILGKTLTYQLSQNDLDIIQTSINELRGFITKSKFIDSDLKNRLLKRLEKLQSELHKNESNLDKFWGLIGDAGVVLGKFGEDAKPFFDRVNDIIRIVCKVQAKAEGLTKSLPIPKLDDELAQD